MVRCRLPTNAPGLDAPGAGRVFGPTGEPEYGRHYALRHVQPHGRPLRSLTQPVALGIKPGGSASRTGRLIGHLTSELRHLRRCPPTVAEPHRNS
jgi:hypothetical protein